MESIKHKKIAGIYEINNRYLLFSSRNIFDNKLGTYLNIPKNIKEYCKNLIF